jgi:hypothetical protein
MNIKIVTRTITKKELAEMASNQFGDWIKGVVDIEKAVMAVGGDLHADEEAVLIDDGSEQKNLWGVNLWFEKEGDEWIEFNSMINIRPSVGNRSRGVENQEIREKIRKIIGELVRV